jgi:type I restriction enzyme S subunit
MKPSGVEWLGDVPAHWAAQGVKFCYSIQLGKMLQPEPSSPTDEETPYLKSQHVQWEHVRVAELPTMWTNKKERRQYAVRDGDLLVCEGGDVGRAAVVHGAPDGTIIQNALHRVRPQGENETGFLLYVLAHAASQGWFEIVCNKSTIAHFTVDKFGALGVALPKPIEQRAIAGFLDRETRQVDRLVAKKRALIERLAEKRTALISRTVTLGLPPAAARAAGFLAKPPLKPSGVAWLGDIPAHWTAKPVKIVARIGNGSTPSRDNPLYWEDGDYPWLNSSVVNQEAITGADQFVTALALRECHLPKIAPPAVLIGITGQGRTRGMASTLLFEATINQHVAYLKPYSDRAEVGFLRRVFDMAYPFLRSESDGGGSTKGAITCEQIANLKIPVPPLPEQAAIAAYLDVETAKLDALVAKIEEAVERLQEYRTALITAAVTGKIDVR